MKELSIEEKAKAYEEAIERARKHRNNDRLTLEQYDTIDIIFPELRESEDERIRKGIITYLSTAEDKELIPYESWIAWLEKQGEHANFRNKIQIGDKVTRNEDGMLVNLSQLNRVAKDEKQGEQKSAEFKPLFRVGDVIKPKDPVLGEPRIIKGIHPKFGYDTNNGILDFEFEDNWELVEQKPAWSEEDEYYYGIVQYILNNECVGKADRENAITWYNFLKDRVQPQPKQEWNEEDEKCCSIVIAEFSKCAGKSVSKDEWMRCNDWLNSLRDRVQPKQEWNKEDEDMLYKATAVINRLCAEGKEYVWSIKTLKKLFFWLMSLRPQSHWKPSDEQIKAIKWVMDGDNPENWSVVLKNLYQDLKKLKG